VSEAECLVKQSLKRAYFCLVKTAFAYFQGKHQSDVRARALLVPLCKLCYLARCVRTGDIKAVKGEDAFAASKMLARQNGILVGISSGAAFYAALKLSEKEEYKNKKIVVLLPDTGDRYLSTPMFD